MLLQQRTNTALTDTVLYAKIRAHSHYSDPSLPHTHTHTHTYTHTHTTYIHIYSGAYKQISRDNGPNASASVGNQEAQVRQSAESAHYQSMNQAVRQSVAPESALTVCTDFYTEGSTLRQCSGSEGPSAPNSAKTVGYSSAGYPSAGCSSAGSASSAGSSAGSGSSRKRQYMASPSMLQMIRLVELHLQCFFRLFFFFFF